MSNFDVLQYWQKAFPFRLLVGNPARRACPNCQTGRSPFSVEADGRWSRRLVAKLLRLRGGPLASGVVTTTCKWASALGGGCPLALVSSPLLAEHRRACGVTLRVPNTEGRPRDYTPKMPAEPIIGRNGVIR